MRNPGKKRNEERQKKRQRKEQRRTPFERKGGVTTILIVAKTEYHLVIVRLRGVVVATRLAVVVATDRWNLLSMPLTAQDSRQTLSRYHVVGWAEVNVGKDGGGGGC